MASLPAAIRSKEVQSLADVRLKPAKAALESPTESTPSRDVRLEGLASTVESALLTAHGSQKAAAIEIGIDQSQMKRQIRIGTFDLRQMSAAGDAFLAAFGEALVEQFGERRKSKRQAARERLPELFAALLVATEDEK